MIDLALWDLLWLVFGSGSHFVEFGVVEMGEEVTGLQAVCACVVLGRVAGTYVVYDNDAMPGVDGIGLVG